MTTTSQRVITATAATTARRSLFWIIAAAFAVLVSIAGIGISGSLSPSDPLSASNPAPAGAKALVEVLRDRGVDVAVTDTLAATRSAIDDPGTTTLLYYDPTSILDSQQRLEVAGLAGSLVLVAPDFDQLTDLAPDVAQAGDASGAAKATCDLRSATRAGTISSDGFGYRYTGTDDATLRCFDTGDDAFSLIQLATDGALTSVVGATSALSNEHITERGNAAFALGLLGVRPHLVWYIPSLDDLTSDTPPTLGELSPGWVLPGVALALVTALAAAVWRGRRFGPLIVENLPVTVRANETMQGRARLYEKSSARLRALDSLRIGAVERLARLCGLPRTATVDGVIAAVAAVTGADPRQVRLVLLDAVPTTDRDLVRLSDELLTLERAVATSVTPT